MSRKNLLFAIAILGISFVLVVYFYLTDFQKSKESYADLIPDESAIVLKVNNPIETFADLARNNQIWKSLDSTSLSYRLLSGFELIDSILKINNGIYKAIADNPLYTAIAVDYNSNNIQSLFILGLNSKLDISALQELITSHFNAIQSTRHNNNTLILSRNDSDTFYLILYPKMLVIADEIKMFKNKESQPREETALKAFLEKSSFKSDASLFINYKNLEKLIRLYTNENAQKLVNLLGNFASWTNTDIKIKDDEIMFNGFTSVDSSSFLAKFQSQEPLPNKVIRVLPFNTSFLFNQCFSNFKDAVNTSIAHQYKNLIDHIGSEVAFVNNASLGDDFYHASFAVIQLADGIRSQNAFIEFAKNTGSTNIEKYESYLLYKNNDVDMLENLFGKMFAGLTENWFTFLEDYIVFSNTKESLINFIRLNNTGKTLDLNENYIVFSDNISTKSNTLVYFQPESMLHYVYDMLYVSSAESLESQADKMDDIQGVVFQFNAGSDLFYTNFYLKHSKTRKAENLALWKVQLDEKATGKPTLVWDHNSKNYNVVVFDVLANMYLINANGQIQWKKRIDGQPLSEIYEVDYYRNGKIQYLFNTKDFIYLIDKNGRFVESYPIKISPSATNGISLFDYKGNKDYRLMIAQADKKVHNYTIKGQAVFGWNKPKTKDFVDEGIARIVSGNKDYFVITDMSNDIVVVNRRGNERIKLKEHFDKARNSAYYENKTNSKGIILTTDEKGRLVYISSSGRLQYTTFDQFTPQHYFLYKDFKGDGVNEFIYLDGRVLKVYDRFKKVLFSYEFNTQIEEKPVIFNLGRATKALGVVASEEKTIYLFDQNGNTIINRGIVGQTPFTVGSIKNDNELNLITASGNVLYNYRLK